MTKGQRIRERREQMHFGLTELAERVNITKQTLYKYENDIVTNIPSDKIEELAKVLNTTPAYLMGWEETIEEKIVSLPLNEKEMHSLYRVISKLCHNHTPLEATTSTTVLIACEYRCSSVNGS